MADDLVVPIDWESARNWADYYLEKEGAGIADDLNLARAYLAVAAELRMIPDKVLEMGLDLGNIERLQGELKTAREVNTVIGRTIGEKDREILDLKRQLADVMAERDSYRDMAKARDDDLAAMRSDLGIARNQCAIMEKSLATVARRMDDQKAQLADVVVERDTANDVEGLMATIDSLNEQLAHKVEWRKEIEAQLRAMTEERDMWKEARRLVDKMADAWCQRAKAAEAQLTASEATRGRMREALELAERVFAQYHNIHMSKAPPDYVKAEANLELGRKMEAALAEPGKAGEL